MCECPCLYTSLYSAHGHTAHRHVLHTCPLLEYMSTHMSVQGILGRSVALNKNSDAILPYSIMNYLQQPDGTMRSVEVGVYDSGYPNHVGNPVSVYSRPLLYSVEVGLYDSGYARTHAWTGTSISESTTYAGQGRHMWYTPTHVRTHAPPCMHSRMHACARMCALTRSHAYI